MLCRMPVVNLPDEFTEQLERSESGTIKRRSVAQCPAGVAAYRASNGSAQADIFVNFKMDGAEFNINCSIDLTFSLPPYVYCKSDDLDFDPDEDEIISIKVSRHSYEI